MKNVHKPSLHPFPRILLGLLIYLFLSNANIIINMLTQDFDRYERLAYKVSSKILVVADDLSNQLIPTVDLNRSPKEEKNTDLQRRMSNVKLPIRIKNISVSTQSVDIEIAEAETINFKFPEVFANNSVALQIKLPSAEWLNAQSSGLKKTDSVKVGLKKTDQKGLYAEGADTAIREIKVTDTKVVKEINLKEIYLKEMYLKALDRQDDQKKLVSKNRDALELAKKGFIFESAQLSIFQHTIKSNNRLMLWESKKNQPHINSVLSLTPQIKSQINIPEVIAHSYSLNNGDENLEFGRAQHGVRIYISSSQKLSSLMSNAVYNIVTGLEIQTAKEGQLNEPFAEKLKLPSVVKQILIEEPKATKQEKKSVSNIIMPVIEREIAQENEVFNTEPSTSIRGEMKLLRGSGGEITGCKISHLTIDADWCTGSSNKDGASCSVLYKNGRVLSVRCK